MTKSRSVLTRHLEVHDAPLLVVGVPNALTARIAEEVGVSAVYLSGAGLTNTYLGAPDVGLLSVTEVVANMSAIREAVEIPVIVDADTGFGNAVNTYRTVRLLEQAGANAIQIEDQVSPKRCGHFDGKSVIGVGEMIGKIHAALDARESPDTLIIARTDALANDGVDEACERASSYLDAGADIAFVEAPTSVAELAEVAKRVAGPLIVNMVEGGSTPILPIAELGAMGYSMVLYANTAMRVGIAAMAGALEHLRATGDTLDITDRMTSWNERQRLVRKPFFDALSDRYAITEGSASA